MIPLQVQYAQERIAEMNEKLSQGTNYVKEKSEEAKDYVMEKKMETEEYVNGQIEKTKDLLKKQWDAVYGTTMYIPSKALKISGEVFISTREIVFAYTQVSCSPSLRHRNK